uniref:Uncharacterized protein n=1 Tax=Meloidogyne enterolobii TaxID=390850 RepID=A0A6V7WYE7_MELEN|nr:unnamed protein product [Meloidogyne enterolobii]
MPYSLKIRETISKKTSFRCHFKINNEATKFSIKLLNGVEENPYIGNLLYKFDVFDNLTNVTIKTGDVSKLYQLCLRIKIFLYTPGILI